LKRLERQPLSGGGNFRSGSTPYDSLNIAFKFADGNRHRRGRPHRGAGGAHHHDRTASVPTREFDLKGTASLTTASNGGSGSICPSWCRARGTILDLPRPGKPAPPLPRRARRF